MKPTRHIAVYAVVSLISLIVSSCRDEPVAPEPQLSAVDRTVLVYMVADNSLGSQQSDLDDIKEMVAAAAHGDLGNSRLLVYRSARNADGTSIVNSMFEITSGGQVEVKKYDNSELSVSYARMKRVIADAKAMAPADVYGLILWGHGSGWLQNGVDEPGLSALSFGGDSRSRWMNITTLREVISGEEFDWLYFDCCYMASVEVVYELRDVVDYIVGSATELPGDGMPYDKNLRCLMPRNSDLLQACSNTFNLYDTKLGDSRTCTMSLIDTSGLDRLAAVTREIYGLHSDVPAGFSPQKFMIGSNCTYFDFQQYVQALSADSPALADEYEAAMAGVVKYAAATPYIWNTVKLTNHCGLSTFILKDNVSAYDKNNYSQLQWWNDVASYRFN